MSAFKPQQRRITIQDRDFHFVCYEGRSANPKKGEQSTPAMWHLMVEGRRCPVLPYDECLSDQELDSALVEWAESNAMGPTRHRDTSGSPSAASANPRFKNWWGLS